MTQFKKNIPLNITGPSYLSRSSPLSSQETRNYYQQIVEEGSDNYVLHPYPGLKLSSSAISGKNRGGQRMAEVGFRVAGNTLYSFTEQGVHTVIGTIPGTQRCIFTNDGTNLVIVDPGVAVYIYDGSTITTVTDANIAGSIAATYLNNQVIYTKLNLFTVADVGNPSTASGLNSADAESQPDDIIHAYSFQQSTYMFGARSTEPWWNNGVGSPPFERIDGQIFEVGCAATHSIANTDEAIYWLGDDNAIYRATGGIKDRVSSIAISHAISTYSKVSDAVGYTFTFEGQNFYAIHFPSANASWCVSESLGTNGWFQLSSGLDGGLYQGTSLINVYGKNFLFDEDNGNLYELDLDTATNNNETIIRRRITGTVNGKILGAPGSRVQMSRLEILMEKGVGTISGQGENPKIIVDISYDGGRSWVPKGFIKIGRLGEFTIKVEVYSLDSFYDAIFRITLSDPVIASIYSASIDLRLAGR